MPHHVESDIAVPRFAFDDDDHGRRLTFPRAEVTRSEGRAGQVRYGIADATFEGLVGRLDTLRWTASAATLRGAWLRDDHGRFDISIERLEVNNDVVLTRGASGVEMNAPQATLHEMKLTLKGPFGSRGATAATPPARPEPMKPPTSIREMKAVASGVSIKPPPLPANTLRQGQYRFLDSLAGKIAFTMNVKLDLPVIGTRTLDQKLVIPVENGSIDFRALEDSLDWLEGAFLDIDHDKDKLALRWKVPIIGKGRDLLTLPLDDDATKLAAFGRVPVRSLLDSKTRADGKVSDEKRQILKALSIDGINLALSLLAPRSLEVGGGTVMFGGDDAPGMVGFKVTGGLRQEGPGKLAGQIGSVDTTIKDLHMGPVVLSADRLHLAEIDHVVVIFDGFTPSAVELVVHRVTATNLALNLGGDDPEA